MMWLKRIAWLLGLLFPAVCYLFTLRAVYAAIVCICALVPLVSGLILLFCRRISIQISLPDSTAKNERFEAKLLLRGRGPVSAMPMRVKGTVSNLLTGEITPFTIEEFSPIHHGREAFLTLECPRCGKLSVDVMQVQVYDLLGIFRKKCAVGAHASMLVLPNTFEPKVDLSVPDMPDIESDEYSAIRPGDDPSELFGIREYREGDLLKSIHWKLSEKYDRTVVKEMSLPVAQSILLLLDNCPTEEIHPDKADLACEALLSVSQTLADLNVAHRVGWFARETGMMQMSDIASLDDLFGEQALILAARMIRDESGLIGRILDDPFINQADFHRVLIFGARPVSGTEALNGNVSVLLPEEDPSDSISCLPEHLTRIIV